MERGAGGVGKPGDDGSTSPRGAHRWSRPAGCRAAGAGARSSGRTAPPPKPDRRIQPPGEPGSRRRAEATGAWRAQRESPVWATRSARHPRAAGPVPMTTRRAGPERFQRELAVGSEPGTGEPLPMVQASGPRRGGDLVVAHHEEGGRLGSPLPHHQPDRPPAGVSSDPPLGGAQHRGGVSRDRRDTLASQSDGISVLSGTDRRETAGIGEPVGQGVEPRAEARHPSSLTAASVWSGSTRPPEPRGRTPSRRPAPPSRGPGATRKADHRRGRPQAGLDLGDQGAQRNSDDSSGPRAQGEPERLQHRAPRGASPERQQHGQVAPRVEETQSRRSRTRMAPPAMEQDHPSSAAPQSSATRPWRCIQSGKSRRKTARSAPSSGSGMPSRTPSRVSSSSSSQPEAPPPKHPSTTAAVSDQRSRSGQTGPGPARGGVGERGPAGDGEVDHEPEHGEW